MYSKHLLLALFCGLFVIGRASAAITGGLTTFLSAGAAQVNIIHDTAVNQQVDTYSLELRARLLGGSFLFDQFFNAPLGDPTVQTAVTQAQNVLTGAGALSILGPSLLSNLQSLVSSTSMTVQNSRVFRQEITGIAQFIGPQTIMYPGSSISFSNPGTAVCDSYSLGTPSTALSGDATYATFSGCNPAQQSFFIPAGTVGINSSDLGLFDVFQTTATKNTVLHTQIYELDGIKASAVPEPNSSALLLIGLLGLVAQPLRKMRKARRAQR